MRDKKVMIITGGAGGIGSAIARSAARKGYVPIILYREGKEAAVSLEKEIGSSLAMQCDISSEEETRRMTEQVIGKFGRIDALVHCASPKIKYARFEKKTREEFESHLSTSFFGAINCIRHVLPSMLAHRKGSIVTILSQNVIGEPQPGFSDYVGAKYALLGLTKSVAVEYGPKGIRANSVSPGMVETGFLEHFPRKAVELEKEAKGGLTSPEEVANAVFLVLEDEKMNGKNLLVLRGETTIHG